MAHKHFPYRKNRYSVMRINIKPLTLVVLAIHLNMSIYSQQDTCITMDNNLLGGFKYYVDDRQVSNWEVQTQMLSNQDALDLFKKGTSEQTTATVLCTLGGGLIGWPIGGAIAGKEEPAWSLAGVGAVLLIIGIPIHQGGTKKIVSALNIYNKCPPDRSSPKSKSISFGVTENLGIGICIFL